MAANHLNFRVQSVENNKSVAILEESSFARNFYIRLKLYLKNWNNWKLKSFFEFDFWLSKSAIIKFDLIFDFDFRFIPATNSLPVDGCVYLQFDWIVVYY